MSENPNYYAIIPANVRYSNITPNAKLLYGEITALANKTGICYASNNYFAELYGVTEISISKWISELVNNGFIDREIIYKEGTKEILNRYIRIVIDPIKEKFNTSQRKVKYPIKENFKDNNTSLIIHNNNTINNINNYQLAVDFWLKDLHVGWTFDGVHGKSLKSILKKLQQITQCQEHELNNLFVYFCHNLPEWYKDKDLPVLNSKFNEIITEIKNKKNGITNKKSRFNQD